MNSPLAAQTIDITKLVVNAANPAIASEGAGMNPPILIRLRKRTSVGTGASRELEA